MLIIRIFEVTFMDITRFTNYRDKVLDNCSKVIVGKEDTISLVLTSFICSGHVLLEDVPGTGKTMLLRQHLCAVFTFHQLAKLILTFAEGGNGAAFQQRLQHMDPRTDRLG